MAIRTFVADDNPAMVEMLAEVLEPSAGFELVGWAHDGRTALQGIRRTRPDLLVLDMIMPVLDGFGVLEALGADRPKVAVFSALGSDALTQRALCLGADAYFVKPLDLTVLQQRLQELMGAPVTPKPVAWEDEAALALHEMGMPVHVKGYRYFRTAIAHVLSNGGDLGRMGKLYALVSQTYNTTPSRAERMMRHAIESTWDHGSIEKIERYFGYTVNAERGRPSNSQFIAMMADRILLQRRLSGKWI